MSERTDVYPNIEPEEDKIYRIVEAAAGLIPAGQSILHSLISPPIQRRTERWINETESRLAILEAAGTVDLSVVAEQGFFSSAVMKAIQVAAVTSQEEKLRQLQNFVVNLSLAPQPNEDEIFIILSIIDELTPSHIKALHFYCYPQMYGDVVSRLPHGAPNIHAAQGGELSHVFGGDIDFWQNVFSTGEGKNLLSPRTTIVRCNAVTTRSISGRATTLGVKLLEMIKEQE